MARRIGHLAWFGRRTFEVLSSWSTDGDDAGVSVAFAEQARQRGWHAELWFARLPELREVDASAQVVPSGPGVEAFCDHLASIQDPTTRLAVVVRVLLPHEMASLARLRSDCRQSSDRTLLRTVELVRRDLVEHWERCAELLEEHISAGAVDSGETEALLRASGGILGDVDLSQ